MSIGKAPDPDAAVTLFDLIDIGYCIRDLWVPRATWPIRSVGPHPPDTATTCRQLLEAIDQHGLHKCRQVAGAELERLLATLNEQADSNPNAQLGAQAMLLQGLVRDIFVTARWECSERTVYVTYDDREVKLINMLHNCESWFRISYSQLYPISDIVLNDFRESARCFAAGFAPSAAMFVLRAMEGVIRRYVKLTTGTVKDREIWGTILGRLKKVAPPINDCLLTLLDDLREKRNETMHADVSISWEYGEVRQIILNCQIAMTMMEMDLHERLNP